MNVHGRQIEGVLFQGLARLNGYFMNDDSLSDESMRENFYREEDSMSQGSMSDLSAYFPDIRAGRDNFTEIELRLCQIWMNHRGLLEATSFISFGSVAGYIMRRIPGCFLHPTGDTVLAFASLYIGSITIAHFLGEARYSGRVARCTGTILTAAIAAYGMR